MSILPSFISEVATAAESETSPVITIPKEYEIDFNTGQLTGKIVSGKEAIKVWIWNALHTQRYRYPIYSWQYGTDIDQYMGAALTDEYIEVDLQDEILDALQVNPYITGITNFTFKRDGAKITVSFLVETNLGTVEEELNVNL